MASRAVSPGGAILRASRLFSLPPPLPTPPGDFTTATSYNSDSATKAFPTLQAVTTPESSRIRGDWGFKRPFPLKSTAKSSTPAIRVKHVDSIEHVTDFSSAADHTLSLKKFQEMNLPITIPSEKPIAGMDLPEKSVFEEEFDFTAIDAKDVDAEDKRWKFKGPWLAGMTEGEFNNYLKKQVRNRRLEFRQFLRERLAVEMTQSAQENAMDKGEVDTSPAVKASDITDEQLTDYLRKLRQDRAVLYNMVGQFLDLAPIQPASPLAILGALSPDSGRVMKTGNPYAKEGPPITHPSGGISYLRTASYLENHPVYGPQKTHSPIKSRILSPRNQTMGSFTPKLGVGGFVGDIPSGFTAFNMKSISGRTRELIPGLNDFDPEAPGGSKVLIQANAAKIDSQGKIILKLGEAREETTLVAKEMVGEAAIFGQKPQEVEEAPAPQSYRKLSGFGTRVMGNSQTYGLNSPSEKSETS